MTDLVTWARGVLEDVTPGPWKAIGRLWPDWTVSTGGRCTYLFLGPPNGPPVCAPVVVRGEDEDGLIESDCLLDVNSRFIAVARDLVPAMADRIEELERELAMMKGETK